MYHVKIWVKSVKKLQEIWEFKLNKSYLLICKSYEILFWNICNILDNLNKITNWILKKNGLDHSFFLHIWRPNLYITHIHILYPSFFLAVYGLPIAARAGLRHFISVFFWKLTETSIFKTNEETGIFRNWVIVEFVTFTAYIFTSQTVRCV